MRDSDNLLTTADETNTELEPYVEASRKRGHDQMISEGEKASSAGQFKRMARRLG